MGIALARKLAENAWKQETTENIPINFNLLEAFSIILEEILTKSISNATLSELAEEIETRRQTVYQPLESIELQTKPVNLERLFSDGNWKMPEGKE